MSDFKGRHFEGEIVLWAVRWYCRYGVSYGDLEQMIGEPGVCVDHSTIYRWVQKYAPEIEKRLRWQWRHPRSTSGRVDETYVRLLRERVRSGLAAARARGKVLGRQLGQRPKSDRSAPKVLALVDAGRSYRLISRELGLSKNTVADIVKRRRQSDPGVSAP